MVVTLRSLIAWLAPLTLVAVLVAAEHLEARSAPVARATGAPPDDVRFGCVWGTFGAGLWPGTCWRPFASTSPFNRPIPPGPRLLPRSREIVSRLVEHGPPDNLVVGAADTEDDWAHPTYYSRPGDPVYEIRCTRPWGRCEVEGERIPVPAAARPAGGGDRHLTVVDQATGWEYDLWGVQSKPPDGGTLVTAWGGKTHIEGDGLGSGGTAAGFANLAGIIRAPELMSGRIEHALFMTAPCDAGTHVHPANQSATSCREDGLSNEDAPPLGARFQLAMSAREIDALRAPAWKKTILHAMATYGMYFGDTGGSSWSVQLESGSTYTSFGFQDPLVEFARAADAPMWEGHHVLRLGDDIDWRHRLRVVHPCVTAGTCLRDPVPARARANRFGRR
jgi:hypothetical protein